MTEEIIRNEILQGLQQVDSSFFITSFYMELNKETRQLNVSFTAQTDDGKTVNEVMNYA